MDVREAIGLRFRANIARVWAFGPLWHSNRLDSVDWDGDELPSEEMPDLLRAAVVLLHASLEDLFRSIMEWKLPVAAPASLERIPLASDEKDKEKFTLVDLAEFRGQSVDSVIARSVVKHLERSNFNHPGDLAEALRKSGVEFKLSSDARARLGAMMIRRHWIVHRMDRDLTETIEPGKPQRGLSISSEEVFLWIRAVEVVGEAVLKEL